MFRLAAYIVLSVVLAGALFIAVAGTWAVGMNWIRSDHSLANFEARIRHYTDSMVVRGDGWHVVHVAHPIVLFVGCVAGAWLMAAASALTLRRLLTHGQQPHG
jgi:hypothetical protein